MFQRTLIIAISQIKCHLNTDNSSAALNLSQSISLIPMIDNNNPMAEHCNE